MPKSFFTKDGSNFFHVSSAFQKSIRRCDEHRALYYATELDLSGEIDYVWYRLFVMASEDIGMADSYIPGRLKALHDIYLFLKAKNNKHKPERLPFVNAVILMARAKKSRLVDNKLCLYYDLRDTIPKPEYIDAVFDMHTKEGRAKNRGNDHFYIHSAAIANYDPARVPDEFSVRNYVWNQYRKKDGLAPLTEEMKQTGQVDYGSEDNQ